MKRLMCRLFGHVPGEYRFARVGDWAIIRDCTRCEAPLL